MILAQTSSKAGIPIRLVRPDAFPGRDRGGSSVSMTAAAPDAPARTATPGRELQRNVLGALCASAPTPRQVAPLSDKAPVTPHKRSNLASGFGRSGASRAAIYCLAVSGNAAASARFLSERATRRCFHGTRSARKLSTAIAISDSRFGP